jgi:hypothetical protein
VADPDLDRWIESPILRVRHERSARVPSERLWEAALSVRLRDTGLLGRLVRWRIPGTEPELEYDRLFRSPPFTVLEERPGLLVSGLVGRIWTPQRDYPLLEDPDAFRDWRRRGTARVLIATWAAADGAGGGRLVSESRVDAFGPQGRLGLAAVRPLVAGFHGLVASDGIAAAVRLAEPRAG